MTRSLPVVLAMVALSATSAHAQDVAAMPDVTGLGGGDATACAHGEADACVRLADVRFRAADGARANQLYRRAADLARVAFHVPARRAVRGPVRSWELAVRVLEHAWTTTVVRAAALHGSGDEARAAEAQIFGAGAVSTWNGRRARVADAFASVHTMTEREGGAFASLAWLGNLQTLAADGACWELRFAAMNLDFVAYVDDAGQVLAVVHFPEG